MRPRTSFLERWADLWYKQTAEFLQSYLATTAGAVFIPRARRITDSARGVPLDKAVTKSAMSESSCQVGVIPIRGIKISKNS